MINRTSIDLNEWKEKLVKFDFSFVKYFDAKYKETSLSFVSIINSAFNLNEWEKIELTN